MLRFSTFVSTLSAAAVLGSASRAVGQGPSPYAARRAAALGQLGERLLIVPSREAFKTDDQAAFKQTTDFQYFTGLSDLVGAVLAMDGLGREVVLFLPAASAVITRPRPQVGTASAEALGVHGVLPIDSLPAWLARRFSRSEILVSPTDARGAVRGPVPMAGTVTRWGHYLTSLGYPQEVATAIPVTRVLREIKDPAEVAILSRVGVLSGRAMLAGMRALRPGRRQREVEAEIVSTCVRGGGMHSFWPWAMSGPRGVYTDLFNSFVDYDGHDRAMQPGELVRVDVGCQLEQYMGDVGRTAPVSGRFSPGQREAWDVLIAGYRAGLGNVRDGARVSEIFERARRRIGELGPTMRTALGARAVEELLSPRGIEAWQFHNVGLDDAEGAPAVLKTGMVVAYEIMYALDGEGYYLEDILLIEPNGYRNLTAGLPYTAAEIERAMVRAR